MPFLTVMYNSEELSQFKSLNLNRVTDSNRCSLYFHKVVKTGVKVLENEKADETRIVRECFHSRFV